MQSSTRGRLGHTFKRTNNVHVIETGINDMTLTDRKRTNHNSEVRGNEPLELFR